MQMTNQLLLCILKGIYKIFFKSNATRVALIAIEIIIHIIVSGKSSNNLHEYVKIHLTIIIPIPYRQIP